MTVRPAQPSDSAAIAELTAQLGYPAAEPEIQRRLARITIRSDQRVWVAVHEGRIAGWLQASTSDVLESGFRVEIVGLVVSPDCRRGGVGRELVRTAEQWAQAIGANTLVVRTNTQRIESHSFYPALGFQATKTQTVYRKPLPQPPESQ